MRAAIPSPQDRYTRLANNPADLIWASAGPKMPSKMAQLALKIGPKVSKVVPKWAKPILEQFRGQF